MAEIIDSIADPFTVLDEELRVLFCNRAGAQLIGLEPRDLIGKRAWDIIPEAKDSPINDVYRAVMRDRQPQVTEQYFAPWDRWFEARIFPLAQGVSVYTRDITE